MVTIIKNQLLKHLSRFTKNLSPEQINVSALKGQGSLSSLQLDEAVLTDLLELPPWMKLSSATCARATFRVHWTKLKTMPIELNLDDIQILIETCAEPRTGDTPSSVTPAFPPSKYSFIHKVIDGITITVNSARIQFSSPVFVATVQMSKINVESKTPQWQKGDLRLTRLKDPNSQTLLIFKEVSWQSARIEAKGIKEGVGLPPLRLLTNQAFCRITIKKRVEDCFVVGSRIVLILEEALWVLTDKQLGAALAFADSLSTLVKEASSQITRDKAQRKLETLPEYLAQYYQSEKTGNISKSSKSSDPLAKLFTRHDVVETSYHFYSPKIDLHLCDDPGLGRSSHPSLISGAALQVTLQKLQLDYYPYHLASADRNRWPSYRESSTPHSQWLKQALSQFRGSLLTLLESSLQKNPPGTESEMQATMSPSSPHSNATHSYGSSPAKKTVFEQFAKLMTTCVILRLEDYVLYKVTTGEKKEVPKAFISSDRERFTLPDEVRALHVEFTHFYYPGNIQFPVPSPKLFIQINPTRVLFDLPSCLWCNSFVLNLLGCVKSMQTANQMTDSDLAYVDITVEAIMPRVVVECSGEFPTQKDRPRSLMVQVSRASITNSGGMAGGTGELSAHLAVLNSSSLLSRPCCTDLMFKHASGDDILSNIERDNLTARALWGQPKLVWCVRLEPVWADFCGARASPNKPTPLLDAVPFTFWVYINMDDSKPCNASNSMNSIHKYAEYHINANKSIDCNQVNPKELLEEAIKVNDEPDMQIIGQCNHLVSIQLNHYQYLVVMRLAERLTELAAFLTLDAARVAGPKVKPKNMVFGCIIPQIEVTLVLPSTCPGKESSRDLDSVLPDSSSLVDFHQNTESGTLCYNPHGNSLNILSQSSVERQSVLTSSMASVDPSLLTQERSPVPQDNRLSQELNSQDITNNKDGLPNIPNINASISSMKRGFTNFMSTLDAALKSSEQSGQASSVGTPQTQDQYQWDAVSVASSDSERYIMVQLAHNEPVDNAFKLWDGNTNMVEGSVEVAAEVIEQSSSPSERSLASSCRRRDLVSMCTFKIQHVQVLQVSRGFYSRVSLNIEDVSAEDCPSIPWDELQSKFASRTRGWADSNAILRNSVSKEVTPKIHIKLDHFPHRNIHVPYNSEDSVSLDGIMSSFSGNLDVSVKDVNLTLNMSTAMGLSDFTEDEIIVTPLPLEVLLEDVCVILNEDRPASSISSPGNMPLKLSLSGLKLVRGCDGVLHLRPANLTPLMGHITSYTENIESSTVKKLAQENEELRRRLNVLERLALENDALRRSKEESDILKSCLLTAQDEVATLLSEKSTLLATVRSLQERSSGVEVRGNSIVTWARSGNR